jgi:uncharacterized protein YacL
MWKKLKNYHIIITFPVVSLKKSITDGKRVRRKRRGRRGKQLLYELTDTRKY